MIDRGWRRSVWQTYSLQTRHDGIQSLKKPEKAGQSVRAETTIEPSSFTEEKYALFRKYQMNIHNDSSTPSGFERFLVESPLLEPIIYAPGAPSHLPRSYGSYHQLYRLDGKLIAVGVIDILPHCVSSVYFFYDDTWEEFSLGKLSALREISLVCEMRNASVPGMDFLDPSYDGQEMTTISQPDLDEILMVSRVTERQILTQPIATSLYWDDKESRESIMTYIDGMGLDTAKEVVIVL
ncbi:hypothetical protein C0989_000031 [Termitomyces sp. Mn162]|nr:hypothetical protein C0989_000031 [Termitomyces sp. Mn162]